MVLHLNFLDRNSVLFGYYAQERRFDANVTCHSTFFVEFVGIVRVSIFTLQCYLCSGVLLREIVTCRWNN